jgi:pentatricopeptide repeat protein
VPAQVKGKLLYRADSEEGQLKLEREMEPEYSLPLAAAFAFAESLQHGACGHDGIKLNQGSYNALIKACVYRGALWRAMHVLDTAMPDADCPPDAISYNLILSGLAAVGDIVKAQEYYVKMQNTGIKPDAFTVRAIVDGLLNMGDTPGAVTVVQDFFNQHSILPPYTTHTKILEFCLARDMVYEAKRYIYFLQQLWRWKASSYDDEDFVKLMDATQRNTQLQKPALQKLFAYFGEELTESDFLP